jgi:hypothetical protein
LLASAVALSLSPATLLGDAPDGQKDAGGIAYHYVGRVRLDLQHGTGIVYGYLTALSGLETSGPLFKGAPGENTAYVTFRADISFQQLPVNGITVAGEPGVIPILVQSGPWAIYFTPNPNHQWDSPDTFSSGQVVAMLDRAVEQFSVYPTFSINAGAAVLRSSTPFSLGAKTVNLRDLMPRGAVDITSGSPHPLVDSTAAETIFAFAGYSLAAAR